MENVPVSPPRNRRPPIIDRLAQGSTNPSSATTAEFTEHAEDLRGPLGLNILHPPPPDPLVDIIFVHGLGGGSRDTWSKTEDPYHFWPQSWLPRDPDFKHARIHSFGYAANHKDLKSSLLGISDFARSLLMELKNDPEIRKEDVNTRIVLIGYSLGGLVTKQAYIVARQDQTFRNIASRIHSMYFLATPHRGADLARTLTNILRVIMRPKSFVADLEPTSGFISNINDVFRLYANDLQLCSFYESKPSHPLFQLVVDRSSGTMGYPHEHIALLNADHRDICKFEKPENSNYRTVRNALSATVNAIITEVFPLKEAAIRADLQRLAFITGVSCAPDVDLLALKDARFDGSCEWLDSKKQFEEWQCFGSEPSTAAILWLIGNPGSGKSVITSYVVDRLKEQGLACSYFFFRDGDRARSTVGDCLRSLAYQMALIDKQVRKRLLYLHDNVTLDLNDERAVWQKFFVECIFQKRIVQPHYWVVDALNQCSNHHAFFLTVGRISQHMPVRILVASRHTTELSRGFEKLGRIVTNLRLQVSDTIDDINRFIMDRSERLAVADEKRLSIASRIITKAGGSFLWVRLVMQELESEWSLEGVERVLNEVPADMNLYYTKILDKLYEDSKKRELVEAILIWTVCASRLLTVDEMQYALKLDIKQTPLLGLEKLIASLCGQLVFVDQGSRVQEIHHTAKDFLLRKDLDSRHAIDRSKAHTRLVKVCLEFLLSNDFRNDNLQVEEVAFANYACEFFSDHLLKSSLWDSEPWDALLEFLSKENVLTWIEKVATTGDLHIMMRTATNVKAYLDRRARHYPVMGLIGQQVEKIKAWSIDLIRVCAKFRTNLLTSPASIKYLIPPMCPPNSMLAKQFTSPHRGLTVVGSATKDWDDCLSQINYFGSQTTAVACGDRYFAVGLSTGKVMLYHNISSHAKHVLEHQERVKILKFGPQNKVLASSGVRHLRIWDLNAGHEIWSMELSHPILALVFSESDESWLTATQDGYVTRWSLEYDIKPIQIHWAGDFDKDTHKLHGHLTPTHAAFSPDCNLLAVGYRAHSIMLYAATHGQLVYHGECVRESNAGVKKGTIIHYPIATMTFNPNPEFECFIISYRDGELTFYNTQTLTLKHRLWNVNAQALACSPDGRTLVAGGAFGSLRIYDLDKIRDGSPPLLIYRLNANSEGIRGFAFSNDNLQFIGIRGSQCRVWEPAVLVRRESQDGDSSELSDPISLGPENVHIDDDNNTRSNITAMACHHEGNMVFCGKSDGSVALFETESGREVTTLYRHASDISINFLAWGKEENVLISTDESSRVIIRRLDFGQIGKTEVMVDRRFDGSITALLLNLRNDRLLISGDDFDELWTLEGDKVACRVHQTHHQGQVFTRTICHPQEPDWLITFEPTVFKIYAWVDLEELTRPDGTKLNRTCAPLLRNSEVRTQYRGGNSLIELLKSNWDPSSWILECWRTGDFQLAATSISPLPGFETQGPHVEYIIMIKDNTLFYLDTDMWVCSLDLNEFPAKKIIKRHFFIPSDWRSTSGDMLFQLTPQDDFLFAKQSELMVIKRGLGYSETVSLAKMQPPLLRTLLFSIRPIASGYSFPGDFPNI